MTYEEIKTRALVLADEVGNEEEYAEQLVEAVNQVQSKLVLFARNNIKYVDITAVDGKITLPSDCYELIEVKNSSLNNVNYIKVNNNTIKIGNGDYTIKYKSYLENLVDPQNETIIDIDPIAETCMVMGVASWIAVDNPELYDILANEYNNLLANLSDMPEVVNENSNGFVERIGGWYW